MLTSAPADYSARAEAALLRSGRSGLSRVLRDAAPDRLRGAAAAADPHRPGSRPRGRADRDARAARPAARRRLPARGALLAVLARARRLPDPPRGRHDDRLRHAPWAAAALVPRRRARARWRPPWSARATASATTATRRSSAASWRRARAPRSAGCSRSGSRTRRSRPPRSQRALPGRPRASAEPRHAEGRACCRRARARAGSPAARRRGTSATARGGPGRPGAAAAGPTAPARAAARGSPANTGYSSPISPRQARFSIRQNAASSGVIGRAGSTCAVFAHQTRPCSGRSPSTGRPKVSPRRAPRVSSRYGLPDRPAHSATISSSCQVSATALARSVSRKRAPSSTLQVIRVAVGSRSSCASSGSGPARRCEPGLCASSSFSALGVEPAALPEPPGLDVEHRRVAPLRQRVNPRADAVADAVAADVDGRRRRQPRSRARPRRASPPHAARSTRGRASRGDASSAGSSAARASPRSAPRLAS